MNTRRAPLPKQQKPELHGPDRVDSLIGIFHDSLLDRSILGRWRYVRYLIILVQGGEAGWVRRSTMPSATETDINPYRPTTMILILKGGPVFQKWVKAPLKYASSGRFQHRHHPHTFTHEAKCRQIQACRASFCHCQIHVLESHRLNGIP